LQQLGPPGLVSSIARIFIRFEGKELSARAFHKDRRVSRAAVILDVDPLIEEI
jgi:hypothetical protein